MAITTSAMVATVFVLNLYGMKEKPVPIWAKRVFITYLARILCMCNCLAPQDNGALDSDQTKLKYKLVQCNEPLPPASQTSRNHNQAGDLNEPLMAYKQNHHHHHPNHHHHHHQNHHHPNHEQTAPRHLNIFENAKKEESKKSPGKPDYAKDWVHVAAVCDRLFFWLCLTFIVITTLMLFHPLTTSRYFKIPILEKSKEEQGL